ncbi:MAG: hypothetical protein LUD27_06615, partial [Clostridia bacterium]|nr:hypothetical protein [Clostridia bacterium]
ILDLLNTLSVAGVAGGTIKLFSSLSDTATNLTNAFSGIKGVLGGVSGILGSVKGILDGVRGCFEAWQNKIKANTLFKIASAVALLVGAIVVLTFVDEEKLSSALLAITMLFAGLVGAMAVLSKIGGGIRKLKVVSDIITAMAVAVLILALAIKSLSDLDNDEMIMGVFGVAALIAILVAAVKAISVNSKTVMKGATQIVIFALAIKVLASACKSMAKLSWGEMARGLVGVAALIAAVAIFLNTAKFSKRCFSNAAGMLILAVAIKILASACGTFAKLKWEEIKKGLVGIGALLAELVAFTNIIKPNKMISTGIGMIAIAAAVCILASAMHSIASLSWEDMIKGLLGIAGGLAALVVALQFVPKGLISKGIGLIAVATAMLILSSALNKLGNMSWTSIAKGLLSLGGAMLILAVGLNAMKGTLSGSAALLVAAIAIMALVPSLALLGSLSWKTIGKGLLFLAATFAVLGIAALVLTPVTPTLLALAAALLLVGVGTAALGVGIIALSAGLTAFSVSFVSLFAGITSSLAIILEGLLQLVISVASILAKGIIQFVTVLGEGAPIIMEAAKTILLSLLNLLYEVAPELISTVLYLLVCILETLVEYAPQIVQVCIDLLIACLEGILNNVDKIIETGINVVVAFIDGIASKLPDVIQAAFNLIISFINGLADAIDNNASILVDAIYKLIKSLLNAIKTFFSGGVDLLKDIGKNIMQGLVDGIKGMFDTVKEAVTSVGNKVKNWFCDLFGINSPSKVFMEYGQYMDEGLANGIDSYAGEVEEATEGMGEDAINGMQNALEQVATLAESGEFSEPTIRPVMDLSEIQNGAGQISQLMDNLNGYNVNGSVDIAQRTSNSMSSGTDSSESSLLSGLAKSMQKIAQNQPSTFENTFNITGDNPKEIAEEVSRIIEKQVQRRNASWG